MELFEAGDESEVGEKGLTLSGGQKARITLARAVYSQAETLLLDDVLAALECVVSMTSSAQYLYERSVHTAKWVVEKCLKGDIVKGRTVILVVRAVHLPLIICC